MAEGNQRKIAHFLKHHLDAGTFPFLEWLKRDKGVARMAWTHGSKTEGPLCRRWHVERNGQEPPENMKPPKLKHIFDMAVKNGRGVHYLKDTAEDGELHSEREAVLGGLDGVSFEKNKKYFIIEEDVLHSDSGTPSRPPSRQIGRSSRVATPCLVTSAPTSVLFQTVSPESGYDSIPATVEELTPDSTQDSTPDLDTLDLNAPDNVADTRSDITADTARSRSPLTCTTGATGTAIGAVPKRKTSTGSRRNSKKSTDDVQGTSTQRPIPGLQYQVPGQLSFTPRTVQCPVRAQQSATGKERTSKTIKNCGRPSNNLTGPSNHASQQPTPSYSHPSPGPAMTSDILAEALREINPGPHWANSPVQVIQVTTAQPSWNGSGDSEQRQQAPRAPNFRNAFDAANWVDGLTPRGVPDASVAPPDLTNYVPTTSISSSEDRALMAIAGIKSSGPAQGAGAGAVSAMDVKSKSSKSVSDAEMKSLSEDIEKISLSNPISVTSSEARVAAQETMVDNRDLLDQLQSKPLHQCVLPEPINDQGKEMVVVVRCEEQIVFAQIVEAKCRVVAFPDLVRPKRGLRPIPLWRGSEDDFSRLKSQTRDLLQSCRAGIVLECSLSGNISARAEIDFPLSKAWTAFRPPSELQPRDEISIFNPDYWSMQRHPYLEKPEVWIYVGNNPDVVVGVVTRKAHDEYRDTVMRQ